MRFLAQPRSMIILLALLVPAMPALAAEQAIFGPVHYERKAVPPNQFSVEIALLPTLVAPFRLHVQNGNPDGTRQVSSATIIVNGAQVAGPSDFSQQVAAFDRTIALQPNNTLQVRLTSAAGSFLALTLFGTIPPPTLSSLLPPALPITQGGAGTLTATITTAQPTPTSLDLRSDHPETAALPPTATVPAGELTVAVQVTGLSPGIATIMATLNGSTVQSTITVVPAGPRLTSLLPTTLQVAQGAAATLNVTLSAAQANDTDVPLTSSDPSVVGLPPSGSVTVPAGRLSQAFAVFAISPGLATIAASLNDTSAESQVTVVVPVPTVVSLSPSILPITAEGSGMLTVTLNAAQPTDTVVALTTGDPTVIGLPPEETVTVPAQALAAAFPVEGLEAGLATVTALLNGTTATAAIEVRPVPPAVETLACPLALTPAATGLCTVILSATALLDTVVPLASSDPEIVSVSPSVTIPADALRAEFAIIGRQVGITSLTAGPIAGSSEAAGEQTDVQVVPPPPTLLSFTPATATIAVGAAATLTLAPSAAQPTETVVAVTSSAPGIVAVPPSITVPAGAPDAAVTIVGLTPGTTTITAGPLNGTQAVSEVSVSQLDPAVTALTPPTLSLPKGTAETLTVTLTPTPAGPTVVPLGSSAPASVGVPQTVTVPAGASGASVPVLAESEGTATVTAGPLGGSSQAATVTVTPPELLALAVTPAAPSIARGQSQAFTAIGTFTDAKSRDLADSAIWGSSAPAVATITSPGGVATGLAIGQATITATVQSVSATATLTVTPPILTTLTVIPLTATVDLGATLQFQALGTLTDGTTQDLTGSVIWGSSAPAVATITSPGGVATGLAPGTTTITASHAVSGLSTSTLLTVRLPLPTITGFAPPGGQVGDLVMVTGTHFITVAAVAFNGTSAPGFIVTGPTSITATVPTGATTGPISVTTSAGTATSADSFVVLQAVDFLVTAAPAIGMAIPGAETTFSVSVVAFNNYANLVGLSVAGLPGGVTATLTPAQVAPGASSLLSVTAPGDLIPSTYSFTVTGTGLVNGVVITRSAPAALGVLSPGTPALAGRVVTTEEAPLPNVTIRLGAITALTDGGGNFLLTHPPTGTQVVLIDGSTASTPTMSYPTIPVTVMIAPGQVTFLGLTPHLHAQPVGRTVPLIPGQATTVTDPTIPGFIVQIPQGVTIIGWDGQPNTQIGMRVIPPDRSPLPSLELPSGSRAGSLYMFYFGKVGGGTPTAPVPIIGPNELGGFPGEGVDLYFYDEAPDGSRPNTWAKYGTGTVSSDGTQILPDLDATGQPYGMPRFCCGAWRPVYPPPPPTVNANLLTQGTSPGGTKGGEPVDLATGFFTLEKTDLVLPGRLPLALTRTYRSGDTLVGPFGVGGRHSYDAFLVFPTSTATEQLVLVLPDLTRYAFARQADGGFRNATDPAMQGAIGTLSGSTRVLTFKDQTVWTFDGSGRLIAQRDRNGNQVTIGRDSQGRVTSLTEPGGRQLLFSYSGTGLQISQVTDPLGRTIRYSYDGAGRLSSVTDPAGGVTSYTYDANHRLLTITDPRGITFLRNEYDSAGRVSRQVQADGGVWSFAYMLTSGVVTETRLTDPRGHTMTYRFNTRGYLLGQTDALGQTTTLERAVGTNLLLSTTDPLGRVTRFAYDLSRNVTSVTDPQGNVRTFTYEPSFNRLTSLTDPLGSVTRFTYDGIGNLTAISDPLTNTTTIAYNAFGQPTSTTDALGNVMRLEYGPVGDLTTITDPLGNASTRTYDVVSRLLTQTDSRGKASSLLYDALNRTTQIIDPVGGVTRFSYDGNGSLLTVTDALNHTLTHEYDSMDRLSRRIDPLGAAEIFTYDPAGNLVSTTDRKGQTATFIYDALNRRMRVTYADGAVATFAYDAAGRLVLADDSADPHRPITLAYDDLARLMAETTGLGTVAYEYDILGRRTQMRVNDLSPVTYTYDANSRLRTITQAPLSPVDIQYDALGRRMRLTLPNAVSTEYQYDAASRLTALIYRNAAGMLGDLTYTYDASGNRTGVGGTFAGTLLPDPVASATYDAANRQLTFGTKTMTFDTNGNLSSLVEPTGITTFTWDARNRLSALSGPGRVAIFGYDSVGRRAQKTVNAHRSAFQYDTVNIMEEFRNGTSVTYLRGLSVDELFSRTDSAGPRYATTDTLGSTLHLTDANGAIQTEHRYGPFGETLASGQADENPFQFTGREDDGLKLYYYRFRYYHPTLSRFISEDPLRPLTGADLNLYTYVSNAPLNAVDPFGLYEEDVHRDLTFCLAKHAGFSAAGARRIAASNQSTDDNPETSPFAGRDARRDWHFTTEARRADLWQRALDGNLDALGQYMHALQDSYSHAGYPAWRGHFPRHAPDKTYNDPGNANRMARDSYNRLRQYLQATTGQAVPDHWDQIREHVDRFNRARTSHEKRKTSCR